MIWIVYYEDVEYRISLKYSNANDEVSLMGSNHFCHMIALLILR